LPVFYFNHLILVAHIFSQEFFPELYEAQDYSWGISFKVFFLDAHSQYFLNREISPVTFALFFRSWYAGILPGSRYSANFCV
jgi:hypothetical protein